MDTLFGQLTRVGVSRKLPAAMYGLVLIMLEVDPSSTRQCKVASSARLARRTPGHCSRTDSSVKQTTGVEVGRFVWFWHGLHRPPKPCWNLKPTCLHWSGSSALHASACTRPSSMQPAADEIDILHEIVRSTTETPGSLHCSSFSVVAFPIATEPNLFLSLENLNFNCPVPTTIYYINDR